jgi:PAS domain S-box-containing protein
MGGRSETIRDHLEGALAAESRETKNRRIEQALRLEAGESEPQDGGSGQSDFPRGTAVETPDRGNSDINFQSLLDQTTDVVTVLDSEGVIQYENAAVLDVLGYTRTERIGTDAFEYIHRDDRARVRDRFEQSLTASQATQTPTVEFRVRHSDGSWRWLEARANSDLDTDAGALVAISRDVTERKRSEQQLEETTSQTKFALAETDTTVWVWLPDRDHLETLYHPIEQITGYQCDQSMEDFVDQVPHPDDRDRVRSAADRLTRGEADRLELEFRTSSAVSQSRWLRAVGHRQADGDTDKIVGLISDISARKSREQRLEKFAKVVSHDMRNPLNVAKGNLDLVREEVEKEPLQQIDTALERMEGIVEETLALTQDEQPDDSVESVFLPDLVRRCWNAVETRNAELEIADDVTVQCTSRRLRSLFENLFRNAVEHGSTSPRSNTHGDAVEHDSTNTGSRTQQDAVEDGSTESVTVTVGRIGPRGFYVEDDGPGIPPDQRENVFEAGYSTRSDGTGFGLSIVSEIASTQGWTVTITDSEAGGARFEFTGVDVS